MGDQHTDAPSTPKSKKSMKIENYLGSVRVQQMLQMLCEEFEKYEDDGPYEDECPEMAPLDKDTNEKMKNILEEEFPEGAEGREEVLDKAVAQALEKSARARALLFLLKDEVDAIEIGRSAKKNIKAMKATKAMKAMKTIRKTKAEKAKKAMKTIRKTKAEKAKKAMKTIRKTKAEKARKAI